MQGEAYKGVDPHEMDYHIELTWLNEFRKPESKGER